MLVVLILAIVSTTATVERPPRRPLARVPGLMGIRRHTAATLRQAEVQRPDGNLTHTSIKLVGAAPPAKVWDVLTRGDIAVIWKGPAATFRTARDRDGKFLEQWPGLEVGQKVFLDIHALRGTRLADIGVGLRVDRVDAATRTIEFSYTNVGPSVGSQKLVLAPIRLGDGTTGTEIVHESHYRGKSLVAHLLYPPLHNAALKAFYRTVFATADGR